MSRLETILIIVLIVIFIAWMSVISYFIFSMYRDSKENQDIKVDESSKKTISENVKSSFHTDFFNNSIVHAEKVLFGNSFDPQYGESGYYGNRLIDTVSKLNNDTKKFILTAIKYMSIEPAQARANENLFRAMAEAEKVPLWFIILRESVKKAVPEFSQSVDSSITTPDQQSNVIPLYARTG